jgi:hypothetical protein
LKFVNSNLREGIDYTIMFYGGRLLNHLSPDDPDVDEFISLRRLNRHLAVAIDSDKAKQSGKINTTKRRIVDSMKDPGLVWVTQGRNIENSAWARKSPQVSEVLPLLYLHGLSTSDFGPALEQFLGSGAGLSATTITRLTAQWRDEAKAFVARDLSGTDYVYLWVDGIHLKVRLEQEKLCLLVMIGVRADGRKELVALADGYRESTESWADLLRDCRRRGMTAPVLGVGDGALGFRKAVREVFPATREQRCWFHKQANVLAALPKSAHPAALAALKDIYNAEDIDRAQVAIKAFAIDYGAKYPRQLPRSSTTPMCSCSSTSTRPSTGSTCAPPTRSNQPSPPCDCEPKSPKVLDPEPRELPWPTSSSMPHKPAGEPSTHHTWSPWSEPAPSSTKANCSNAPPTSHPPNHRRPNLKPPDRRSPEIDRSYEILQICPAVVSFRATRVH